MASLESAERLKPAKARSRPWPANSTKNSHHRPPLASCPPASPQLRHGGAVDLQFCAVHEFSGEIDNQIYQQVRWVRLEDLTGTTPAADRGLIRDLAAGKLL